MIDVTYKKRFKAAVNENDKSPFTKKSIKKSIYKFKMEEGPCNPLELVSKEYKKVIEFWKGEDKSQYPYAEYTKDSIIEIKKILNKKNATLAAIRGINILMELSQVHFKKQLSLNYILNFCPTNSKMWYLAKYMDRLKGKAYWEQLRDSYVMQDYSSVPHPILVSMFNIKKEGKEYLMDEESRELFESLPEKVNIYRAMSKKEFKSKKYRISWTLDKDVAQKFLKRNETIYKKPMVIQKLQVSKKDITAIFLDRQEMEVIYLAK